MAIDPLDIPEVQQEMPATAEAPSVVLPANEAPHIEAVLRAPGSEYPSRLKFVDKQTWPDASVERTPDGIRIQGRLVMEPWQKGYMDEFAEVVTVNGGRVLEIGFGSGFSANAIQKRNRVKEHVIVEPNKNILDDVRQFAESATATVTPVRGLWQDVIDQFEDSSFDGIFFDGSPFNEDELYNRQFHFGEHAFRLLKKGGIYTYCNLTGFGQLRGRFADWETFFRESQLPSLQKIGFTDIQYKIVAVDPPLNHEKYRFKEAMIPIAIR